MTDRMTETGRQSQAQPETRAVAERILEEAGCEACLAAKPNDER